jgi:phage-related protein
MAEKKLSVVITGDAKGAQDAFGKVNSSADGMSGKLSKVGGGIGKAFGAAALGGAAIGAGLVVVGGQLLTSGAQVEGWRQKTKVVFEGQAGDVRAWADKNNEAFGVTDDELAGLAASFGDLLKPMGFTSAEAAKMSTDVVGLSGALSSWSGGSVSAAEASDVLAKAMLGERDGLKGLGISITEADLSARLAAKGQGELTGAALEQAKAVATQELIFEKSTDAQKAWADGGNKALVSQNKLKAGIAEAKETIATALTPALAAAVGWIGDRMPAALAGAQRMFESLQPTIEAARAWLQDKIPPAVAVLRSVFEGAVAWIRANWPSISATIGEVLETARSNIVNVLSIVSTLWQNFGDNILAYVDAVWPAISNVISGAMEVIRSVVATVSALLKGDWGAVWEGIKGIVSGAIQFVTGIFQGFQASLSAVMGVIVEVLSSMWSGAWEGIKSVVSAGISAVAGFFAAIPGKIVSALSALGSLVGGALSAGWNSAWSAMTSLVGGAVSWFAGLPRKLVAALASLGSSLSGALSAGWNTAWSAVTSLVGAAVSYFRGLPGRFAAGLSALGSTLRGVLVGAWNEAWNGAKILIDGAVTFFTGLPGKFGRALSGLASAIKSPFSAAFSGIRSLWNSTVGGFSFTVPDWIPGVGGRGFSIPNMHTGGVVPGGAANEVLRVLQGGEVVLDRSTVKGLANGGTVRPLSRAMGQPSSAGSLVVQVNVAGSVRSDDDIESIVDGINRVYRSQTRPVFAPGIAG